jgi:hypothetical protein
MSKLILNDAEALFLATRVTHAKDPAQRGFLLTWDRETDEFFVLWQMSGRGVWVDRDNIVYDKGPAIPEAVQR